MPERIKILMTAPAKDDQSALFCLDMIMER